MSLIIARNFKRANAQDAVARNAASDELNVGDKIWITQYGRNYPYTITKKWKEGWTVWYKAKNDKSGKEEIVAGAFANALDAAEFHVGQRVRAKDPAYEYSDGKALGAGMFTVKEVNNNGDVKLDDYGDVWISPSELVEANDACGNGKDKCGRDGCGKDGCGKDGDSEYELGMRVFKAVGKVEDEIVAGVRRARQLVNNVPDEDVKRRLNRKLDDIAKIADSFDETFI